MRDEQLRQAERSGDAIRAAWEARRRGEVYDLAALVRAGLLTVPEAHEDWRAGRWVAPSCERCQGAAQTRPRLEGHSLWTTRYVNPVACPLCLGTGYQWSERHAVLLAYAGHAGVSVLLESYSANPSLQDAWDAADGDSAEGFAGLVAGFSSLAPLAAAWGVAKAWHDQGGGKPTPHWVCPECEALAAVWAYLCDPSEERRADVRPTGDLDAPMGPVDWLALLIGGATVWRGPEEIAAQVRLEIGPEAVAEAARSGVRRWVGRIWGVES